MPGERHLHMGRLLIRTGSSKCSSGSCCGVSSAHAGKKKESGDKWKYLTSYTRVQSSDLIYFSFLIDIAAGVTDDTDEDD